MQVKRPPPSDIMSVLWCETRLELYILQRGVRWKQGVVNYTM